MADITTAPVPVRSPLPESLAGSTVLIIGGSSGIGLGAARLLHGLGARVVLAGRDKARLDAAVDDLRSAGGDAEVLGAVADAADEDAVRAAFDLAGTVDHVLLTAGGLTGAGPIETVTADAARLAYEQRVWGALITARIAAERLPAGGSVTLTSGVLVTRPRPGVAGAIGVAGGVETLVGALAVELAPRRVRVNAVRYGQFDTPLFRGAGNLPTDDAVAAAGTSAPLGRFGTAEEAGAVPVVLMANPYLNGQIFTADGGQSLA
ncbi:SDR family oxidoreductase [Actinomadura rupiterrae]|uniref:SDR family oxidoreductase n=1 Tax=Actinomadura rupiterrae TaxID=559627 RepID=UPI0020A566F0|nr:SDR family oxidoreductase [Actinomadura rupiterrae]MCP2335979.1 NAD(P)-dependent dehydrogenase (short-subunit alcohol dehydrogenase family) [Actinomadura rupiterrae]